MRLRPVFVSLLKNWHHIDSLFLFTESTTILQPLCSLIDGWKLDSEEGEPKSTYTQYLTGMTGRTDMA